MQLEKLNQLGMRDFILNYITYTSVEIQDDFIYIRLSPIMIESCHVFIEA